MHSAVRHPVSDAIASLFVPGLGQWLQQRRPAAIYFALDVAAAIGIGALMPELRTLAWISAAVMATWSVVDAAVAAHRSNRST